MNLAKYQELTGVTVPASRTAIVTASLRRTRSILETMLGFTLDTGKAQQNLYNEVGKTSRECSCPSVDTEDLEDPDEVEGSYRLFSYNENDTYFHIDPFVTLYKVKLVFNRQGEGDDGVTIKTFDDNEIRVDTGRDGLQKYIQHCQDCLCVCGCHDCVQLAVDAEWYNETCVPLDLQYVWADMVTWYTDSRKDIKSQSIDTHSYTKFDRVTPETEPHNLLVIKKYSGPYGSVTVAPTISGLGRRA